MANSASTNQITIAIPAGVEPPKFKLFDRVKIRSSFGCTSTRKGVVSGMTYISFRQALHSRDLRGWEYLIDYLADVSEDEALEAPVATEIFCEANLELDES